MNKIVLKKLAPLQPLAGAGFMHDRFDLRYLLRFTRENMKI